MTAPTYDPTNLPTTLPPAYAPMPQAAPSRRRRWPWVLTIILVALVVGAGGYAAGYFPEHGTATDRQATIEEQRTQITEHEGTIKTQREEIDDQAAEIDTQATELSEQGDQLEVCQALASFGVQMWYASLDGFDALLYDDYWAAGDALDDQDRLLGDFKSKHGNLGKALTTCKGAGDGTEF